MRTHQEENACDHIHWFFKKACSHSVTYKRRRSSTARGGGGGAQQSCISFLLGSVIFLFSMFWILEKRKRCCQVGRGGSFCNSISLCNFVSRGWSWKVLSFSFWCSFWNGETWYTISDFSLWVCIWRIFIYTYSYFLLYWSL